VLEKLHITGAKLKLDEDKENIVCVNHEKDFTIGIGTKSETKYISVKTIQNESTNYEIWYVTDSPGQSLKSLIVFSLPPLSLNSVQQYYLS
jgi:hypothetical protein